MNKDKWVVGIAGLVLGAALAWVARPWLDTWLASVPRRHISQSQSELAANMDAHFIEQMIPHHEDALRMADIALEKAEHEELKQLARNIKRTQSEEIAKMKEWYKEWYGTEVPQAHAGAAGHSASGQMHMGMMGNASDVENLKAAKPFDKAFIEQMIPHHQMAVMMSEMLLHTTQRSETTQLAADITAAQNREIEQMRSWYQAWYGK